MSKTNRKLKECKANCHFYLFEKAVKKDTTLFISEGIDCGGTTSYERYYEHYIFADDLSKMGSIRDSVLNEIKECLDFL